MVALRCHCSLQPGHKSLQDHGECRLGLVQDQRQPFQVPAQLEILAHLLGEHSNVQVYTVWKCELGSPLQLELPATCTPPGRLLQAQRHDAGSVQVMP